MLRGFRWQFAALLLSVILFITALALRPSETTAPPTPPPPTDAAALPTITPIPVLPTSENVLAPSALNLNQQPDHFTEALVGRVQRLNPLLANLNPVDRDLTRLIFDGLTTTNAYGEPIAALADRWVIASDNLDYVVYLRDDVRWQDGTPFTADDVVFTMELLRAPDFPGSPELGAFWRTVETQKLDTHIVRFRLAQPLGTFLDRLQIGILPVHALEGTRAADLAAHPFNITPIGTGAYQVEALRGAGGVIRAVDLRVSSIYREREPDQAFALDRISFQLFDTFDAALAALRAGEVDALHTRDRVERPPVFDAANTHDIPLYTQLEPTLGVLVYNWAQVDYFREQRVRAALAMGVDRTSALERTMLNLAVRADSPLFPGSWAYTADTRLPAYDPVGAQALLITAAERMERLPDETEAEGAGAEATEAVEPTGIAPLFTFSILTPDDPALVRLANEIATQWAQLNVRVSVESADPETYQARLESGEFQAAIVEYALGTSADPDVYAFWHEGEYPDGRNYGGVSDRAISEALERARRDPFGINRAEHYDRFQRDFTERAVALPLYYPLFTYAVAPRVQGVQLGVISAGADRFRNIAEWRID